MHINKYIALLSIACIITGCGSINNTKTDVKTADVEITEETEETEEAATDELTYLLDNGTTIYLEYQYDTEVGGCSGESYQLDLYDTVSRLYYRSEYSEDSYEERSSDYTIEKYEELRTLIKSSNPSLYNVNDYADESGKIVYETLDVAVLIHGATQKGESAKTHLLVIDDISSIEDFFKELKENSDITYTENANSSGYLDAYPSGTIVEEMGAEYNTSSDITLAYSITGGCRVRQAPDTDSEIVASLTEGEAVDVLSVENEWTKVKTNGVIGYVYNEFLTYTKE